MTYPWWFQALVAFAGPFSGALAAGSDWQKALAPGVGGLVALMTNKGIKKARKG
jgi:hypothetical protein